MRIKLIICFPFIIMFSVMIIHPIYAKPYQENKTNIIFPQVLANWERVKITDNEKEHPGMGITIGYNCSAGMATIYIYNYNLSKIGTGVSVEVKQHFQKVISDIYEAEKIGIYRNVKKGSDGIVSLSTGKKGPYFLKTVISYVSNGEENLSYVYLTGYKNQFIKIRITYKKNIAKKEEIMITDFLDAIGNLIERMSDWVLINEWGSGSKTYVDRKSIQNNKSSKSAWIKYHLEPPGKDKINQKEASEMLMFEEYDCLQRKFRVHRIVFNYVDGTSGEPITPEPTWAPATGGNEITLKFICQLK